MGVARKFVCYLAVVSALALSTTALADRSLWSETPPALDPLGAAGAVERNRAGFVLDARQLRINRKGLDSLIDKGLASPQGTFILDLPLPDGGYREFEFRLAGTMSLGLARKFPNIRAFSGRSLHKGLASAQMEVTRAGVSVQVLAPEGRWMIDPSDQSDTTKVKSYFARNAKRNEKPFQCGVDDHIHQAASLKKISQKASSLRPAAHANQLRSRGAELRTYRLAVATTGEYSEYHGGSVEGALSAVVKVVNRVNGIFNSEISVAFELIESNDEIIFTDADTDPFEGNFDTEILINESQTVIDEAIGSENYDIGHTFGGDGGGMASTGPCQDGYKASGVTGGTEGDAFAVDYVAHEIGHQFSMAHTFNTNADSCLKNRAAMAAFEPGSGTTIMSYNGICSPDNIAQPHLQNNNSDPFFHSFSFEQAAEYVEGAGAECGVVTDTSNTQPNVDAGGRYTVPASTPLYIEGAGSDPDGDAVTYSWEQRDLGPPAALTADDDGAIPLFRTYAPVVSARRYLPRLETIISGELDNAEKMPRRPRTMAFALTARDGAGGRNSDTTEIEVVAEPLAGKIFSVAEPDLGGSLGRVGTVRWHVGETNNAPISTAQVEMYLSTDGGQSFQDTPFATAANDGYARVEFPSGVQTDAARVMVKGRNNIFFDVSDADFSLDTSLAATPEVPAPQSVTAASAGNTGINISFSSGGGSGVNYYDARCVGEPSAASFSGSVAPASDFNDTQPAFSTISLTGAGNVSPEGMKVSVDISHGYRGDVVIKLITPSGRTAQLKGPDGDDQADDVIETFTVKGVVGEPIAGDWQLEVSDSFPGDDGQFNSWSVLGTALTPPRTVADSREPKAPFDDTKAVTSAIQLSAEGDVSTEEFEVDVDITHTYRGDVQLELEAPSGKRITLMSIDTADGGDDVKGTYPTTLQSLTPFSELAGEALSGTWTLHVSDQFRGDDGVLNSWAITQNQFVFTGRGASSPIQVQGLPTDQSYDCSIAGVYSEVTPPRQSESKTAGTVALGSPPVTSLAETAFLNLLQTVLAFDPTAAGSGDSTESDNSSLSDPSASGANDPGAKEGELGGSKGVNPAEKDDPRPNAIPTFGAWGLGALLFLMGLMGLRYGRISGRRQ